MTSMKSSSDTSMKMKNKQVKLQARSLKGAVVMGGLLSVAMLNGTAAWAAPGDGLYEVLYTLKSDLSDGKQPYNSLVQGLDGALYGTTTDGGSSGSGTVYRITKSGDYSVLNSLNSSSTGGYANGLVIGADNNFYGLTTEGGVGGLGGIFMMTPAGVSTALYSFSSSSGNEPYFQMTLGSLDNNFYGTNSEGGAGNYGTIFKITPSGTFTLLGNFDGINGARPSTNLIEGSDGNFYGFTAGIRGGKSGIDLGTFFKVTPSGVLTTVAVFGGQVGAAPVCMITKDSDGSFLCSTGSGSTYGLGAVFGITQDGIITFVAPFPPELFGPSSLGANGVILASDGEYYGTTFLGGIHGIGTLFKLTHGGQFTILKTFDCFADGCGIYASPIQADDGNLYSATSSNVPASSNTNDGPGTIFRYQLPSSSPAGVTAAAASAAVQLSWAASKYATSYNVYQSSTTGVEGGTPVLTGITATSATISGLTIGAQYYFKVSAVHDSVESTLSSEVTAIPFLSTPTAVTATGGDNKITLNWSAVSGASSYKIYQATTPGAEGSSPALTGITGTTSTISGLAAGTKYYFTVSAVVGSTESAKSAEVSAITNAATSSSGGGGALNPLMLLALGALSLRRTTRISRAVR